ncbi:MAG TPA: hypothetical protein VIL85_10735 [Thermomicrobiales bacterium]|jgi:hypothetical protein
MNTAKFNGYPFTLHTSLPVEECRRRLAAEFSDSRGRWQHARSDGNFLGWQEKATYLIYLSHHFDPIRHSLNSYRNYDYSRRCTFSLHPDASGTMLTGRYAYTHGERFLISLTLGTLFGIIFGTLIAILGVVLLFQDRAAFWILLVGIALVAGCIILLRDQSDGDFPRERDQIARYLMRVLEAKVVNEPAKTTKPAEPARVAKQ